MKNNYRISILIVLFSALILFSNSCGSSNVTTLETPTNNVIFSFVFMGDNQIGEAGWIATHDTNPSSANIPQLRQNIIDSIALNPKPAFVVMAGDIVMNFAPDAGLILTGQLTAWNQVFASIPGSGDINFLPIIGNHESNTYSIPLNAQYPVSTFATIFTDWVTSSGYDRYAGNGPKPEGENPDKLVNDESKLTFSFNYSNTHFIVINTDTQTTEINPATNKSYTCWIPIHWVVNDIQNAQANPNISTIIVLTHRPINSPTGASDEIINTPQYPFGNMLLTAIQESPKTRALLCSHLHAYMYERLAAGNNQWEFISGNAGTTPLQSSSLCWSGEPWPCFGFLHVKVYSNGSIGITNYRRPVPPPPQQPYEDTPVAPIPAVPDQEIIISP